MESAEWDEGQSKWVVTCKDKEQYRANFLLSACGMLHKPSYSDVKGHLKNFLNQKI